MSGQPPKRSHSPDPLGSFKRHNQDQQPESLSEEAMELCREAGEGGLYKDLCDLLLSDASPEAMEACYTPIFEKLARLFVGRTDIPVPPAIHYCGPFADLCNPNNPNILDPLVKKKLAMVMRGLFEYINTEDNKNRPRQQSYSNSKPSITKAVETAWNTDYQGDAHKLLKAAVRSMHSKSEKPYANFCAIIQGSGTGKSRTVDKFAETVFTIPMVLRPREDKLGYPRSDLANGQPLVDFFCPKSLGTALHFQRRYLLFLLKLIAFVDDWLDLRNKSGPVSKHVAVEWKKYIGTPLSPRRIEMYTKAIDPSPLRDFEDIMDEKVECNDLKNRVQEYIHSVSNKINPDGTGLIIFSFDEAHHLTQTTVTDGEPIRTAYQCLCKALTYMMAAPVFVLFLSTYSRLSEFAPSSRNFWSDRSMSSNSEGSDDNMNAPFVELPFDIWKEKNLVIEGGHSDQEICSLKFMARFGRPLFWTMLENSTPTYPKDAMAYAMSKLKLRFEDTIKDKSRDYPDKELIPLLAIRVDLTFESNRDEAVFLEGLLVASSMRTVYSVPQHRQYLRGGYSSEPFVAEAAARAILNHCRDNALGTGRDTSVKNVKKIIAQYLTSIPSAVLGWLDRRLIDKGTRGELVARMLCTLAHDISILNNPEKKHVDSICKGGDVSFSQMIPVIRFLRTLIAEKYIDTVLDAKPSNLNGTTLREAFKDAFVHFTQFVKAGDKSTVTDEAVYLLFTRGAAIQGYGNMPSADLVLPVWIRINQSDRPDRWCMSAIFIQVKNRADKQFILIDAQETFQFFTDHHNPKHPKLPYITIVMELGILAPEQETAPQPGTKPVPMAGGTQRKGQQTQGKKKRAQGKKKQAQVSVPATPTVKGKIRGTTQIPGMPMPTTPVRKSTQKVPQMPSKFPTIHPRYEIKITGCSDRVYNVIDKDDKSYSSILAHKDMLAEHPRRDAGFLAAIRQMKPYWVAHSSYNWAAMSRSSRLGANLRGDNDNNNNGNDDNDDNDNDNDNDNEYTKFEYDDEEAVEVNEYDEDTADDNGEPMDFQE